MTRGKAVPEAGSVGEPGANAAGQCLRALLPLEGMCKAFMKIYGPFWQNLGEDEQAPFSSQALSLLRVSPPENNIRKH